MHYSSVFTFALSNNYANICALISNNYGTFINPNSYASEYKIVVRMPQDFTPRLIKGLRDLGFIVGHVHYSGVQVSIYLRGYMY